MTPEELIRKRKRDELLKRANAMPTTTTTAGEQLVSDNTKETLKAAGHWAGVIGKRAAELTQKGVAVAAEKAKEAKAQLDAKRAREAQDYRAVEAKHPGDPLAVNQKERVEQLTSELESDVPSGASVLVGKGERGMSAFMDFIHEGRNAGLETMDGMDGFSSLANESLEEISTMVEEEEAPFDALKGQDVVDALSEEPRVMVSEGQLTSPVSRHRKILPWIVGGVLVLVLSVGAFLVLRGNDNQVQVLEPTPVASAVEKAATREPDNVAEGVPVAPDTVEPNTVDVPGNGQLSVEPALVKPSASSIPVPKSDPVVATTPSTQLAVAPVSASPKRSRERPVATPQKKANAPAPEDSSGWQRKANADLDAWAEKSGIE